MKHFFPLALNRKFKNIANKIAFLQEKHFQNSKPIDHQYLIRKHGLDEKRYLDTFSKLMNQ